jgi:hypothetical protein
MMRARSNNLSFAEDISRSNAVNLQNPHTRKVWFTQAPENRNPILAEPRLGNPEKIKSKQKNQDLAVCGLASRVFACTETLG